MLSTTIHVRNEVNFYIRKLKDVLELVQPNDKMLVRLEMNHIEVLQLVLIHKIVEIFRILLNIVIDPYHDVPWNTLGNRNFKKFNFS